MARREVKMDRAYEYARQCLECSVTCLETLQYCLNKSGEHKEGNHLRLLRDCAELSATTANFLATNSFYRTELAMVCAEICDACSIDCEQFEEDETMLACARICEGCATSCRRISIELAA